MFVRTRLPTTAAVRATADGRPVTSFPDGDTISSDAHAAFSPDGKTFAVGDGRTLTLIRATDGVRLAPPLPLPGRCGPLWFTADGRRLCAVVDVTPGAVTQIVAIDAIANQVVATTRPAKADESPRIARSPDGKAVVLFNWDDSVQVFDAMTLATLRRLPGHQPGFSGPSFSPDGARLATLVRSPAPGVELLSTTAWRTESRIAVPFDFRSGRLTDVVFAGDADHVLTTTDNGQICLWHRRRPEAAWGVVALWTFWFAGVTLGAAVASGIRDVRRWLRR